MIKSKKVALVYRLVSLIIATSGFLTMMGAFGGGWNLSALMFYTLQSNVLIIVMFAMLIVRTLIGLREDRATGLRSTDGA